MAFVSLWRRSATRRRTAVSSSTGMLAPVPGGAGGVLLCPLPFFAKRSYSSRGRSGSAIGSLCGPLNGFARAITIQKKT